MTVAGRLLVLAIAAVTLGACGSAPESSPPDAPSQREAEARAERKPPAADQKSVCAMIPKAEMETILGGPLASAEGKDGPGKTQCTYAGFGGRFADVSIEWGNGEAGMAGARLANKLMGNTAPDVEIMKALEGLGDEAMMMIGGVLSVRKGNDLITVDLRTQKNAEAVGPAIARKVIEQM
jgi:hypothetical protein